MREMLPRYPVYIPSKGRADVCLTAECMVKDGVPFKIVVEPQERDAYAKEFGDHNVLVLPFSDLGQGSIPARNWIKEHATAAGHLRHWQLDDNLRHFARVYKGLRLRCDAGPAMRVAEDFVDRYENVAVAGLNYMMFYTEHDEMAPFFLNNRVYSCTLVLNSLPYKWRGRYNEDTDYCLQVLSGGWCTVLINAFLVQKIGTMLMKGGNTAALYQGDGRLKMARSLERLWPGVVETSRRFKRPQHMVKDSWKRFDTPLKLKPGVDLSKLKPNEYGLDLVVDGRPKSRALRKLVADYRREHADAG